MHIKYNLYDIKNPALVSIYCICFQFSSLLLRILIPICTVRCLKSINICYLLNKIILVFMQSYSKCSDISGVVRHKKLYFKVFTLTWHREMKLLFIRNIQLLSIQIYIGRFPKKKIYKDEMMKLSLIDQCTYWYTMWYRNYNKHYYSVSTIHLFSSYTYYMS